MSAATKWFAGQYGIKLQDQPETAERENTMTVKTTKRAAKEGKSKKEVKKETKVNQAKTSGKLIWNGDPGVCVVCGKEIRKGHVYRIILADASHPEKRYYHGKTCGVGTAAWKKFREEAKKEVKVKKKEANCPLTNGDTKALANPPMVVPVVASTEPKAGAAVKPIKVKEAKIKELNEFGHPVGSQADKIDKMLLAGTNKAGVEAAGIIWPWFKRHVNHLKGNNASIHKCAVIEEGGSFRIPEAPHTACACTKW